jgi:hypothetical protein
MKSSACLFFSALPALLLPGDAVRDLTAAR